MRRQPDPRPRPYGRSGGGYSVTKPGLHQRNRAPPAARVQCLAEGTVDLLAAGRCDLDDNGQVDPIAAVLEPAGRVLALAVEQTIQTVLSVDVDVDRLVCGKRQIDLHRRAVSQRNRTSRCEYGARLDRQLQLRADRSSAGDAFGRVGLLTYTHSSERRALPLLPRLTAA